LLIGRLLDAQALSEVNFKRTDPQLALFDSQGKTAVLTETDPQHGLNETFEPTFPR